MVLPPEPRPEPRWAAALTLLLLLLLLEGLHDRYRFWPDWVAVIGVTLCVVAMAGVTFAANPRPWLRAERALILFFSGLLLVTQALALAAVIDHIIRGGTDADGIHLLSSSVVIWVCNLVAFSLLYWQVDGGGPEARFLDNGRRIEWLFPEMANPGAVAPNWRPGFVDYLFLGFSTATAFSTTDTIPITHRAKLLMMAESAISLGTLAVVASRAINVLAS
jgi:hypothetical protein